MGVEVSWKRDWDFGERRGTGKSTTNGFDPGVKRHAIGRQKRGERGDTKRKNMITMPL